jgi:hypothetical protein
MEGSPGAGFGKARLPWREALGSREDIKLADPMGLEPIIPKSSASVLRPAARNP